MHAIQNSETIFTLMASFTLPPVPISPEIAAKVTGAPAPEDGPVPFSTRYQRPLPADIMSFEEASKDENRWKDFVTTMADFGLRIDPTDEATRQSILKDRVTVRPLMAVGARAQAGKNSAQRAVWLQPLLGDKKLSPNEARAMIGYITDSQTVATAGRTVGLSATSDPKLGMVVSGELG